MTHGLHLFGYGQVLLGVARGQYPFAVGAERYARMSRNRLAISR